MLKPHRSWAWLLAVSLSATTPALAAKDGAGSAAAVEGRVLAGEGKGTISGAVVKAYPLDGGEPLIAPATGSKGAFALRGLPFGYYDLVVEAEGATYVGNQVINVAPSSKIEVDVRLTRYAEKSASWWAGREQRRLPGGGNADGLAEIRQTLRGKEFWKSPKGLAIVGGIGAAALLAIASSGGGSNASASTP